MRAAFGVGEERIESLRLRPGIDDLEQVLFAVLQGLGSPPCFLFAAPLLALSLPTLAFDLRLALSFLDESRDLDRSLLQLADNDRDPARKVSGRGLSPLLGPIGPRIRRVGL